MATYENLNGKSVVTETSTAETTKEFSISELQEMLTSANNDKQSVQQKIDMIDADILRIEALIQKANELGVS